METLPGVRVDPIQPHFFAFVPEYFFRACLRHIIDSSAVFPDAEYREKFVSFCFFSFLDYDSERTEGDTDLEYLDRNYCSLFRSYTLSHPSFYSMANMSDLDAYRIGESRVFSIGQLSDLLGASNVQEMLIQRDHVLVLRRDGEQVFYETCFILE